MRAAGTWGHKWVEGAALPLHRPFGPLLRALFYAVCGVSQRGVSASWQGGKAKSFESHLALII